MQRFYIDCHCDTLMRALDGVSLAKNDGHFDFTRSITNGSGLQVMAVFPGKVGSLFKKTLSALDILNTSVKESGVPLCLSGTDIRMLREQGRFGVMASMEGTDALEGDLSRLSAIYRLGVRLLGLTWNGDNALCGGIESNSIGLTALGREAVFIWENFGGIVDVSHASEQGFWDVIQTASKPIIASHSCCKVLCSHKRNLTDDQLRAVADKGGVTGINFYPVFLSDSGTAALSDVVAHILHAVNVCGEDAVGLGSDFDGIGSTPDGLSDIGCLPNIAPALETAGLTSGAIEKIMGSNFYRVFSENIY